MSEGRSIGDGLQGGFDSRPVHLRRSQCSPCPWRDLTDPAFTEEVLAAARAAETFVCHTRMGPCVGPKASGVLS